ncbi:hypothetical protein GH733_016809 [Mirounga leonina]|nr:hypothetical protein GH733_016809 [Mirounga leonina]
MRKIRKIKETRPKVSSHLDVGTAATSTADADAQKTPNHKMAKRQTQPIHQPRFVRSEAEQGRAESPAPGALPSVAEARDAQQGTDRRAAGAGVFLTILPEEVQARVFIQNQLSKMIQPLWNKQISSLCSRLLVFRASELHTEEKLYECDECGRAFVKSAGCSEDKTVHTEFDSQIPGERCSWARPVSCALRARMRFSVAAPHP